MSEWSKKDVDALAEFHRQHPKSIALSAQPTEERISNLGADDAEFGMREHCSPPAAEPRSGTPTPRTDAAEWDADLGNMVVFSDFARTLERELTEACAENARLRAEVEALSKDAGRYRWLREHFMHVYCADDDTHEGNFEADSECTGDFLDAAIDAALAPSDREGGEG